MMHDISYDKYDIDRNIEKEKGGLLDNVSDNTHTVI